MIREYLNKDAHFTIVLSSAFINGGTSTLNIRGKIVRLDDEFAEIEFNPSSKMHKHLFARLDETSGKMLVNRKFISTITLL